MIGLERFGPKSKVEAPMLWYFKQLFSRMSHIKLQTDSLIGVHLNLIEFLSKVLEKKYDRFKTIWSEIESSVYSVLIF